MLSITLELLDKWGRYYETSGSLNGMKIVEAWKELTKENVRFPQGPAEYAFLTKPSASRDAGAFGFGGSEAPAVAPAAATEELSEATLQSLATEVQSAIAQHGLGSTEVAEAKAHYESTLAQWQHAAAEAVEKGDMAAYERLSEVAVRYAELGNRIDSSPSVSTEFSRTFSGVSPSPPDSDTMQESHASSHKKHRRRKKDAQIEGSEPQPEAAMTPSFGQPSWADADEAVAAYRSGEFGGSFGLSSTAFPSTPGDAVSDPFATTMTADGFGGFGASFPESSPGIAQFGSSLAIPWRFCNCFLPMLIAVSGRHLLSLAVGASRRPVLRPVVSVARSLCA